MAVRTQVYLTEAQRARLSERGEELGVPMAELIREAIDDFLDQEDRLDSSFGAVPGIAERMPGREEWEGRG